MIANAYKVARDGTLDDLLSLKARCLNLIERGVIVSTAEKYLEITNAAIEHRREAGEKTMAEKLKEWTGKDFIIMHSQ